MSASIEELEAALRDQPDDLSWEWASDRLIPVMPRIRAYPPGFPEPLRTIVPPGIAVGFAIDIGLAFMAVGESLIRSWGVSLGEVHVRSLANVAARATGVGQSDIVEGAVGKAQTRWLQTGQSIGSVLVLIPDELGRIFGARPAFFITPMRDLVIGFSADVDRELAAWLWLEVAALDPNCLEPIGYGYDGRAIRPEPLDIAVGEGPEMPPAPRSAYVA